jgi:hypothetical protein
VPHRLLVSPTSRVEDIPVEEAAAAIDDLLGQRAKGQ